MESNQGKYFLYYILNIVWKNVAQRKKSRKVLLYIQCHIGKLFLRKVFIKASFYLCKLLSRRVSIKTSYNLQASYNLGVFEHGKFLNGEFVQDELLNTLLLEGEAAKGRPQPENLILGKGHNHCAHPPRQQPGG